MTLKIIALVLSVISIFLVVIRIAIKNRNRGDNRLSVFEHPSVFKKPDIEMVNSAPAKNDNTNTSLQSEDYPAANNEEISRSK